MWEWIFVALFNKSQHIDDYRARIGLDFTKTLNLSLCAFGFLLGWQNSCHHSKPGILTWWYTKEKNRMSLIMPSSYLEAKFFQKILEDFDPGPAGQNWAIWLSLNQSLANTNGTVMFEWKHSPVLGFNRGVHFSAWLYIQSGGKENMEDDRWLWCLPFVKSIAIKGILAFYENWGSGEVYRGWEMWYAYRVKASSSFPYDFLDGLLIGSSFFF